MFELLFMTRCVNYILFILSLCRFFSFFSEFFSVLLSLGLRISCALNLPFHVPHLYATIKSFLMKHLVLALGGNWSLTAAGWSGSTPTSQWEWGGGVEGVAETPGFPHPTPTQSVGSAAHNGRGERAGWDEDSFHKVPLRQRSLPSLRAITPTVSQQEAGRCPHTLSHWGTQL